MFLVRFLENHKFTSGKGERGSIQLGLQRSLLLWHYIGNISVWEKSCDCCQPSQQTFCWPPDFQLLRLQTLGARSAFPFPCLLNFLSFYPLSFPVTHQFLKQKNAHSSFIQCLPCFLWFYAFTTSFILSVSLYCSWPITKLRFYFQ